MVPAEVAVVIPMLATSLWRSDEALCCSTARAQRFASSRPAPVALTVSSPPTVSTSTDCFWSPSPIDLAASRSIAGWVSRPTPITIGIAAAGTNTTLPPMIATRARVRKMKGRSTIAVIVAEAKKSRSASNSRIRPVSEPVDPFLRSRRRLSSRPNRVSPTSRSIEAPAMSTK
jgi:hypothetical protein